MVVRALCKKPKKPLLLLGICLLSSLALLQIVRHPSINNETEEPLHANDPGSRDFNIGVLPGSAAACTSPGPVLVAFVHSSPSHVPHREAIRTTWGSPENGRVRTVFVVGRSENQKIWQKVQKEAQEHKDLVLLDMVDSYKNLTLKHLASIKWVLSSCPDASYVLKSDDDVFVDSIRLLSMLDTVLGTAPTDTLVCHVIPEGSPPKRTGKWTVTRKEYPYDQYPEYCSGQAYFTRTSAIGKLSDVAMSPVVPYLTIDDVFVTGLLANLAGVKRLDLGVRFANNEQPVVGWMKGVSMRPCPWMVTEMSSYYWPKEARRMWNKTAAAWKRLGERS